MMMKKVYGSLRIAWLSSDCYSQNSLVTSHACGEEFNVSAKASASLPSPMKSKCKMNTATLHSICMLVMIFLLLPASIDGLNCYQCYSNTLDPCSYEDYRPCPGLHNRCAIRTRRVHTGELFVKRECSLGCGDGIDTWSTRDLNFSMYCDTRRPDYECKVCCRGDGCNYSGSLGLPVPSLVTVITLTLTIVLTWLKFQ